MLEIHGRACVPVFSQIEQPVHLPQSIEASNATQQWLGPVLTCPCSYSAQLFEESLHRKADPFDSIAQPLYQWRLHEQTHETIIMTSAAEAQQNRKAKLAQHSHSCARDRTGMGQSNCKLDSQQHVWKAQDDLAAGRLGNVVLADDGADADLCQGRCCSTGAHHVVALFLG